MAKGKKKAAPPAKPTATVPPAKPTAASKEVKPATEKRSDVKYAVSIVTSAISGAGTDANVFISLVGTKGTIADTHLDNKANNFEQGKRDEFVVSGSDIGELQEVIIRHDNKGLAAAWHLDRVEVQHPVLGKRDVFHCGQWLKKDATHDIKCTLKAGGAAGPSSAAAAAPPAAPVAPITIITDDSVVAGPLMLDVTLPPTNGASNAAGGSSTAAPGPLRALVSAVVGTPAAATRGEPTADLSSSVQPGGASASSSSLDGPPAAAQGAPSGASLELPYVPLATSSSAALGAVLPAVAATPSDASLTIVPFVPLAGSASGALAMATSSSSLDVSSVDFARLADVPQSMESAILEPASMGTTIPVLADTSAASLDSGSFSAPAIGDAEFAVPAATAQPAHAMVDHVLAASRLPAAPPTASAAPASVTPHVSALPSVSRLPAAPPASARGLPAASPSVSALPAALPTASKLPAAPPATHSGLSADSPVGSARPGAMPRDSLSTAAPAATSGLPTAPAAASAQVSPAPASAAISSRPLDVGTLVSSAPVFAALASALDKPLDLPTLAGGASATPAAADRSPEVSAHGAPVSALGAPAPALPSDSSVQAAPAVAAAVPVVASPASLGALAGVGAGVTDARAATPVASPALSTYQGSAPPVASVSVAATHGSATSSSTSTTSSDPASASGAAAVKVGGPIVAAAVSAAAPLASLNRDAATFVPASHGKDAGVPAVAAGHRGEPRAVPDPAAPSVPHSAALGVVPVASSSPPSVPAADPIAAAAIAADTAVIGGVPVGAVREREAAAHALTDVPKQAATGGLGVPSGGSKHVALEEADSDADGGAVAVAVDTPAALAKASVVVPVELAPRPAVHEPRDEPHAVPDPAAPTVPYSAAHGVVPDMSSSMPFVPAADPIAAAAIAADTAVIGGVPVGAVREREAATHAPLDVQTQPAAGGLGAPLAGSKHVALEEADSDAGRSAVAVAVDTPGALEKASVVVPAELAPTPAVHEPAANGAPDAATATPSAAAAAAKPSATDAAHDKKAASNCFNCFSSPDAGVDEGDVAKYEVKEPLATEVRPAADSAAVGGLPAEKEVGAVKGAGESTATAGAVPHASVAPSAVGAVALEEGDIGGGDSSDLGPQAVPVKVDTPAAIASASVVVPKDADRPSQAVTTAHSGSAAAAPGATPAALPIASGGATAAGLVPVAAAAGAAAAAAATRAAPEKRSFFNCFSSPSSAVDQGPAAAATYEITDAPHAAAAPPAAADVPATDAAVLAGKDGTTLPVSEPAALAAAPHDGGEQPPAPSDPLDPVALHPPVPVEALAASLPVGQAAIVKTDQAVGEPISATAADKAEGEAMVTAAASAGPVAGNMPEPIAASVADKAVQPTAVAAPRGVPRSSSKDSSKSSPKHSRKGSKDSSSEDDAALTMVNRLPDETAADPSMVVRLPAADAAAAGGGVAAGAGVGAAAATAAAPDKRGLFDRMFHCFSPKADPVTSPHVAAVGFDGGADETYEIQEAEADRVTPSAAAAKSGDGTTSDAAVPAFDDVQVPPMTVATDVNHAARLAEPELAMTAKPGAIDAGEAAGIKSAAPPLAPSIPTPPLAASSPTPVPAVVAISPAPAAAVVSAVPAVAIVPVPVPVLPVLAAPVALEAVPVLPAITTLPVAGPASTPPAAVLPLVTTPPPLTAAKAVPSTAGADAVAKVSPPAAAASVAAPGVASKIALPPVSATSGASSAQPRSLASTAVPLPSSGGNTASSHALAVAAPPSGPATAATYYQYGQQPLYIASSIASDPSTSMFIKDPTMAATYYKDNLPHVAAPTAAATAAARPSAAAAAAIAAALAAAPRAPVVPAAPLTAPVKQEVAADPVAVVLAPKVTVVPEVLTPVELLVPAPDAQSQSPPVPLKDQPVFLNDAPPPPVAERQRLPLSAFAAAAPEFKPLTGHKPVVDHVPVPVAQVKAPAAVAAALDARPRVQYIVTITSGQDTPAGNSAPNVSLQLGGDKGLSDFVSLNSPLVSRFQRGADTIVKVDAPDVGALSHVTLRETVPSSQEAAVYVQALEVYHAGTREVRYFPVNDWVKDSVEVRAGNAPPAGRLHMCTYWLIIYTNDVRGVGSDIDVNLLLQGEHGDTGDIKFDSRLTDMERTQEHTVCFRAPDVGALRSLRVTNNARSDAPAHSSLVPRLVKVDAVNTTTGSTVRFPCNKWLDQASGMSVVLTPGFANNVAAEPQRDAGGPTKYIVHVYTSHKWAAGTDAKVFLRLIGWKGEVPETCLNSLDRKFARGSKESFELLATSVGFLQKIIIRHDNTGFASAWHLDKVEVEDTVSGHTYKFPCKEWLLQPSKQIYEVSEGHDSVLTKSLGTIKTVKHAVKAAIKPEAPLEPAHPGFERAQQEILHRFYSPKHAAGRARRRTNADAPSSQAFALASALRARTADHPGEAHGSPLSQHVSTNPRGLPPSFAASP